MAWIAEQLLTAIGQAAPDDCITEARLVELTGLAPVQVDRAALRLRKHVLIERVGPGCHQLTNAGREAIAAGMQVRSGPKGTHTGKKVNQGTLRIRVWRAIRIRRKFSIPDLIALVAQGGERDIESNIGKYLRALTRAGYLVKLPRREPGVAMTSNGYVRWWLQDAKDTGPLAPVWRQSANTVYDPNIEQETPLCG